MKRWIIFGLVLLAVFVSVIIIFFSVTTLLSYYEANKITGCVNLNGAKTCHTEDGNPYRLYGTKTAYRSVLSPADDSDFRFTGCEPKLFYLFSRHATRYPDKEDIEEMIMTLPLLREKITNAFEKGRSKICKQDIEKLMSWNLAMVPDDDNRISQTGEQEAFDLAQRYKKRFPLILDREFNPSDFSFEYTSRERTYQTGASFAKGLFGKSKPIDISGKTNDKVLQFHKDCKTIQGRCPNSSLDLEELDKFEKGPFIRNLVHSISERLGFDVTFDEIKIMYKTCNFAYALDIGDIWCSVFSRDELIVMEYEADIDDYYKDGYGNSLNYEQACPVVDYFTKLLRSSLQDTRRQAVLQFSHAGAIKKVYARLGLFKDGIPLTSINLCRIKNRSWKSSLIAPFNSNIAIVLYHCNNNKEQKIAAFQNEVPVVLGGCNKTLCPVQQFFETYENISDNCNINSMCCTCCVE